MKIVVFDIDATLLSCPNNTNDKSSEMMFKKVFNIDASENLINHAGKTERGIIEEVLRLVKELKPDEEVEVPNEAFRTWGETHADLLKENPSQTLPGIPELLTELSRNSNIQLGILTGNSRFRSDAKLKSAGLKEFFTDKNGLIRGAFGDISNKRADLLPEAKSKLGEGIYIVIDDSLVAAKMIKENNIPAILVATGSATVEQLKEYSPFVFENFDDNRWREAVKIIESI